MADTNSITMRVLAIAPALLLTVTATSNLVVAAPHHGLPTVSATNSRHDDKRHQQNQALLRGSFVDHQNQRELQQSFSLREHPFVLAGVPIVPEIAEAECPTEWMAFATCTITTCSNVHDVCPDSVFYKPSSNSDAEEIKPKDLTCTEIEESFCYNFGVYDCCMDGCQQRMQELLSCLIVVSGGKKLDCGWGNCQEMLVPSRSPTGLPSFSPTGVPTDAPSSSPTNGPTESPTSEFPSASPSESPIGSPTRSPTLGPTQSPSTSPSLPPVPCSNDGDRFSCFYTTSFTSSEGSLTKIDAVVNCLQTDGFGLDVRRSQDCQCEAVVTNESGPDKKCPCSVCDITSELPISVDCRSNWEDPFIAKDCTSLSCSAECTDTGRFKVELIADRTILSELDTTYVTGGFYPTNFVRALGKLFFQAFAKETGYELWVTDGSRGGTRLVKDINPGTRKSFNVGGDFQRQSVELNGKFIFFANDGVHGKELWSTDGSEQRTKLIKDIVQEGEGTLIGPITKYHDKVYFVLSQVNKTDELWVTDGTANGTHLVTSENSIFPPGLRTISVLENATLDGRTYFVASPTNEYELFLYASDGTVEGTVKVTDEQLQRGQEELLEFKNKIYFNSADSLWVTDGTKKGTQKVMTPSGESLVSPQSVIVTDETLYLLVNCDLWKTNGTDEGLVKLLVRRSNAPCDKELTQFGTKVLLKSGTPQQPWISDGTVEGTYQLTDANLTSSTSFVVYKDQLAFFSAASAKGDVGHELYVTDGTRANTLVLPNIGIDHEGLYPHFDHLFVFKNAVYVTVWYLFEPGDELWKVKIPEDIAAGLDSLAWSLGTTAPPPTPDSDGTTLDIITTDVTGSDGGTTLEEISDGSLTVTDAPTDLVTTDAPTDIADEAAVTESPTEPTKEQLEAQATAARPELRTDNNT